MVHLWRSGTILEVGSLLLPHSGKVFAPLLLQCIFRLFAQVPGIELELSGLHDQHLYLLSHLYNSDFPSSSEKDIAWRNIKWGSQCREQYGPSL